MHTYIVRTWLIALYGTMKLVTRKAAQMGHVLPRRTPTGEVLSVASSDSDEFGALTEILARTCTQLVAYLVVAFIVLSHLGRARGDAADRGAGAGGRRASRCSSRSTAARRSSAPATPT